MASTQTIVSLCLIITLTNCYVSSMIIKEIPVLEINPLTTIDDPNRDGVDASDINSVDENIIKSGLDSKESEDPLFDYSLTQRTSRVDIDVLSDGDDKPKFFRIRIPRSPQHFSGGKHYGYGSGTKTHTNFGFGRPGHHSPNGGSQSTSGQGSSRLGGIKPDPRLGNRY